MDASWLGRRVTLRRTVRGGGDGPRRYSDTVGDLVALSADSAVVDTRRGPVTLALADLAIAHLAAPSTADELALESVAASGWRAAETHEVGGWLLRASGGFTWRANSVLPLRAPGVALDFALGQARDWYAARGLPLRMLVPIEARRLLDAELGERGWEFGEDVDMMATRLDVRADPDPSERASVADAPDDGWLGLFRGGEGLRSAPARELLVRHERAGFASVVLDGATVAIGRGAIDAAAGGSARGDWLGVSAIEVDPAYRRQSLATAVIAALWRWGRAQGALRSYLRVSSSNDAGLALYSKLGYWHHHAYRYRTAP